MRTIVLSGLMLASFMASGVTQRAEQVAEYAVGTYETQMVKSLANMVSFKTVAIEGKTPSTHPEFLKLKAELSEMSQQFGFDYADHGYVVLIGYGQQKDKIGVITHGDVQPADSQLWANDPYILDSQSEPGRLIGRGTEDDKGAIVTALYAMKAIKDKKIALNKRIELMIYMAEESNWDPLREFLKDFTPADVNITIDANYPAVTAEKGWSKIAFNIPALPLNNPQAQPTLTYFGGGYISSQVPQQAKAIINHSTPALRATLKQAAKQQNHTQQAKVQYRFELSGDDLIVHVDGKATHSSTPQNGLNALTHLADLLSVHQWPKNQASLTASFVDELIGLGLYAEQFGEIAYQDDFMGPMTLAPTIIKQTAQGTEVNINLRRPKGKTPEVLDAQTLQALNQWQSKHSVELEKVETYWGKPLVVEDAPHLDTLLDVFGHFTGIDNPQPVSIGGSTNSKLFPNALSFGPSMPNVDYTGHTEHEFMTREQFLLNLKMYTAVFIELASGGATMK